MADPDLRRVMARAPEPEASPVAVDVGVDACEDVPDFEPSVLVGAGAIAAGLWLLSLALTYLHIRLV